MAVSLVAYVPYDTVVGGVIDVVQGNGDLGHAEARCQVPGIDRQFFNDVAPQFVAYLRQLLHLEFAQVFRIFYLA